MEGVGRTEDIVPQGMSGEDGILEIVEDELCRRVVVALYLVAYHFHLLVYLRLRIGAAEHDVGEEVYGTREMVFQNGGIVHRVFLVGKGVEVASHALQPVEYLHCRTVAGALEGGMLAEMCHAFLAFLLIACAGTHFISTIHHGGC